MGLLLILRTRTTHQLGGVDVVAEFAAAISWFTGADSCPTVSVSGPTGLLSEAVSGLMGREELAAFTGSGSGGDVGVETMTGFSPYDSVWRDGTGGRAAGLGRFCGETDCEIVYVGVGGIAAVGTDFVVGMVTTAAGGITPALPEGIT